MCPQLSRLWFVHIMEYDRAVKRKELLINATSRMNCQEIILNKKPVPKEDILHNSIYIIFSKWKLFRDGTPITGCPGWGRRCGEEQVNGAIRGQQEWSLWWWKCSVLWLSIPVSCLGYCTGVLEYLTIKGNLVMYTRSLSILFLITLYECTITSKSKV